LYIDPGFTRCIIGSEDEESDALLKPLFNASLFSLTRTIRKIWAHTMNLIQHIPVATDLQVCVKWDDRIVSIWDNRVTNHTAISDYNVHNPEEEL
jgi:sulfonate dioxygenase